jgi:hypothetical protein
MANATITATAMRDGRGPGMATLLVFFRRYNGPNRRRPLLNACHLDAAGADVTQLPCPAGAALAGCCLGAAAVPGHGAAGRPVPGVGKLFSMARCVVSAWLRVIA